MAEQLAQMTSPRFCSLKWPSQQGQLGEQKHSRTQRKRKARLGGFPYGERSCPRVRNGVTRPTKPFSDLCLVTENFSQKKTRNGRIKDESLFIHLFI